MHYITIEAYQIDFISICFRIVFVYLTALKSSIHSGDNIIHFKYVLHQTSIVQNCAILDLELTFAEWNVKHVH